MSPITQLNKDSRGKYRVTSEDGNSVNFFLGDNGEIMMTTETRQKMREVYTKIDPDKFDVSVGKRAVIYYHPSEGTPSVTEGLYLPPITTIDLISERVY